MRKIDDQTILLNVSTVASAAMYQHKVFDGTVGKLFDMPDSCSGFEKI